MTVKNKQIPKKVYDKEMVLGLLRFLRNLPFPVIANLQNSRNDAGGRMRGGL